MKRGLVFGKFLPFHKGHKALIGFALQYCDELIVLVCGSDKEDINTLIRVDWIKQTFKKNKRIIVQGFDYKESELPNTSESSRMISQLWASKFKEILPFCDVLISSEKYGDYVAEYLDIKHILFDEKRKKHQISSSMIREDIVGNWNFIAEAARPFFQKKVVVLGTESTGKSTLCNTLSHYFGANLITEAGRDIVDSSTDFSQKELYHIIEAHTNQIKKAHLDAKPLMIMDTDIHITQSYSKFTFGEYLNVDASVYELHKADLYIYLSNDVPFVQDSTRMSLEMRNALDDAHRQTLKDFNINYHEIKSHQYGNRFNQAVKLIETMVLNQSKTVG